MISMICVAMIAFMLGFGAGAGIIAWVASRTINEQAEQLSAWEATRWRVPRDLKPPSKGDR